MLEWFLTYLIYFVIGASAVALLFKIASWLGFLPNADDDDQLSDFFGPRR